MKRLLLLLPLLLTPAAAHANEIRLSCSGKLDYSAIKGNEAGVELVTELLQEERINSSSYEIVINKDSKIALVTEPADQSIELQKKAPFFETPNQYLIEIKDKSNPDYDQLKQHQINRTNGSYTYIWEVKYPKTEYFFGKYPLLGNALSRRQ